MRNIPLPIPLGESKDVSIESEYTSIKKEQDIISTHERSEEISIIKKNVHAESLEIILRGWSDCLDFGLQHRDAIKLVRGRLA